MKNTEALLVKFHHKATYYEGNLQPQIPRAPLTLRDIIKKKIFNGIKKKMRAVLLSLFLWDLVFLAQIARLPL